MKYSGFMNGCGGKILMIILSVILGVVLTLGGIAGAGYYILTKKGMLLKAEEFAVSKGVLVDFDDTVAQGTVMDWGKAVANVFKDTQNNTVGNIESLIGMQIISNTLNQMLGIEPSAVKDATIGKLGETISANFTMILARDKFGITFPDLPLFSNEEFLAKPISEVFGSFDEFLLGDVINVGEDAHAALKALKDIAIKDLGGNETVKVINGLSLCELMKIDENSAATLKAMQYSTIDSTYKYVGETDEILKDANGRFVYETKTLKVRNTDNTYTEIEVEMQGISDKMKELAVAEVISITASSNAVLRKMRLATEEEKALLDPIELTSYIQDYIKYLYTNAYPNAFDAIIISNYGGIDQATVDIMPLDEKEGYLYDYLSNNKDNKIYSKSYNQLESEACGFGANNLLIEELGGSKFNDIVDDTKIGEFITIQEDSEPILKAFKDTRIKGLNNRIKTLSLSEIFASDKLNSGALALIAPTTLISEIPDAMSDAIKDSTIAILKGRGVIEESRFDNIGEAPIEQQSFIYNSSVGGFLGGVIDFIADPIDYSPLSIDPPVPNFKLYLQFAERDLTVPPSFASLTDFVQAYSQYEGLRLDATITITIDTSETSDDYKNFYNAQQGVYCIPVFSLETATTFNFVDGASNPVNVKLAVYNVTENAGVYSYEYSKHQYAYFYAPVASDLQYIDTLTYEIKS
jgi:hypothetical protein